ncbi:MAG: hypothetical protein R3F59_36030, partial [Myxococcota bacterium]
MNNPAVRNWAKAYADRWGLPRAALEELDDVLAAVAAGAGGTDRPDDPRLRSPSEPPTSPPELPGLGDVSWTRAEDFEQRYEEMGIIGEGGMGEVRRMWDTALNRAVAMKILRQDLADREDLVLRFIEEAQATAQLEHPGIMP